ncbi:glycosyltransferase [Halomonas daqiaonensis]|uniref:UDP-N-acetylglucosamine transferase subunit ALG13 n=1 Tax=Halomonas daqiaonensis TaxID=650850 RepID=A0A1H7VXJ6_9GAMM|nr:glycosyltransferase [Halomonas daqiaonensis]SEM13920.1 UDP-N-acetylglucosamine transferase subunit ALG13 [Halomonas daqiaonensis]
MKVLFTAGTQFAFPRMARAVDAVAGERPDWELVYQAGPRAQGDALPRNAGPLVQPFFPAAEFQALFEAADLVVTHAGMGNIMACLEQGKPFLMMPRLATRGEHRNDHQRDTAEAVARMYGIAYCLEVEPLVKAVLAHDPASHPPYDVMERIRHERQHFGQQLNRLIQQL